MHDPEPADPDPAEPDGDDRQAERRAQRSRWLKRSRRAGRWLAMLAACYVGGVAATNLAPTTISTDHYSATVRISPLLHRTPTLHSPTILGDLDLRFRAPLLAPSIDATVQISDSITKVLGGKQLSVDELRPSQSEIDSAVQEALVGVGLRFLLGASAVLVITTGVMAYARRTPPARRHLLGASTAAASAVLLTAGGLATAYQPSQFDALKVTGVLGALQRNAGILGDVSDRANQASPYIRNMLALSQSLADRFTPAEATAPAALRVLLVSDIHGANYYELLKTIVADQKIDLVIDSGDLVNFGTTQEVDASKMAQGIASLGVPYVFVRGNHDATSRTDTALLTRLAKIPNVVELQDASGDYTEYDFGGLRIAGFNDSRWFGDANPSQAESQEPLVKAFDAAFKGRPEPDILVTHEPYAAQNVDTGSIRINGHMHVPALEGNRIQVGTLTGGGVVSHFVEESAKDGGELTGQPYAFDILSFAGDCRLTTLSRYEFSGIVEGRPVYDSVQVINGSTVQSSVPPAAETGAVGSDGPSGSPVSATPSAAGPAAPAGPATTPATPRARSCREPSAPAGSAPGSVGSRQRVAAVPAS